MYLCMKTGTASPCMSGGLQQIYVCNCLLVLISLFDLDCRFFKVPVYWPPMFSSGGPGFNLLDISWQPNRWVVNTDGLKQRSEAFLTRLAHLCVVQCSQLEWDTGECWKGYPQPQQKLRIIPFNNTTDQYMHHELCYDTHFMFLNGGGADTNTTHRRMHTHTHKHTHHLLFWHSGVLYLKFPPSAIEFPIEWRNPENSTQEWCFIYSFFQRCEELALQSFPGWKL